MGKAGALSGAVQEVIDYVTMLSGRSGSAYPTVRQTVAILVPSFSGVDTLLPRSICSGPLLGLVRFENG
jgi:hypothetical protein